MATENPLTALEAPAAWARHEPEIEQTIQIRIARMRLSVARRRDLAETPNRPRIGAPPRTRFVRETLAHDLSLHDEIRADVEQAFWVGVYKEAIDRTKVGGWLYCVTWRATTRPTLRRATFLFAHVYATRTSLELASECAQPDELVARSQLLRVVARYCAELTPDEHELLDLGDEPRDYGRLSDRLGVSGEALRIRAHRLLKRLRTRLASDIGEAELIAG